MLLDISEIKAFHNQPNSIKTREEKKKKKKKKILTSFFPLMLCPLIFNQPFALVERPSSLRKKIESVEMTKKNKGKTQTQVLDFFENWR
jgi:hypothetical protein